MSLRRAAARESWTVLNEYKLVEIQNAEDRVTSKRIRDQSIAEKIDRLSWSK